MRYIINIILLFMLLFAGVDMASASGSLPFKRMLYVNEWGGMFDSTQKIDKIISDAVYIKADAIAIHIGSEYFEAARDPTSKGSWDFRGKPNYNGLPMLEYLINKAHENNIKVHVWSAVNIVSSKDRAEYRLFGPSANYPYNIVTQSGNKIISDTYRLDMSFKGLQDYEIDLWTWVAKHYPTADGFHIEEPVYMDYSYSTAVRDKVKNKYGYDPLFSGGRNQVQIQKDITDVQRDSWNEFFTRLRSSINANKANPDFQLSANSWIFGYDSAYGAGLDPQYLAKNNLLDWYAVQIGGNTLDEFRIKVQGFSKSITEIPVYAIPYLYYHSPSGDLPNPSFFDRVANACNYGSDGVAIFAWHWLEDFTGGTINGQNIMNTLRSIPTSSCGTSTVPVISPTATPPAVIIPTVTTPTISSPSGIYSSAQSISILTSTAGATIRYTIDGTTPTETSPIYSGTIIISSTTALKARAWKTGSTPSAIAAATYIISPALTSATISNAGFESGNAFWNFYTNGQGTFNIVSSGFEGNNAVKLVLDSGGSNIQLYQTDVILEPNTQYRLSFAAYSTTGHDLTVNLINHEPPYTSYGLWLDHLI